MKPDPQHPCSPRLLRLLVLEDSPADCELAVAALRKAGWTVEATRADTPRQFHSALQAGEPDLIVADFNLGNWTALDALATLRTTGRDVPLIVLTAALGDESAAECIRQGASEYVLKDRLERLPMAAARALESRRLRGQAEALRAELARAKAEFEQMFQSAGDALLVFDEHGRIRRANRAACEVMGGASAAVTGAGSVPQLAQLRHLLAEAGLLNIAQAGHAEIEFAGRTFDVISSPVELDGVETHVAVGMRDITDRKQAEQERLRLVHHLGERVKELNCIYRIHRAAQECDDPEELFRRATRLLPLGLQFPEIACAKIEFDGSLFGGACCADTEWLLSSPVEVDGAVRGRVKLFYTEARPAADEGPFLRQERELIDAVATVFAEAVKRMEVQLSERAASELLRAIVRNSPLAISTVDGGGKIVTWNPAAERLFGWTESEVIGKALPYIHESERETHDPLVARVLRGEMLFGVELEHARKDGTRVYIRLAAAPLTGADGQVNGALAVLEDVTGRRFAEEALRRSEQKYRTLVDNIPDVTWTAAEDATTTFISPNVAVVTGFTAEQMLADPVRLWFSRIHPEDAERVVSAYSRLFSAGAPFDQEYRYLRGDGRWIWLRDRALNTFEADGVCFASGVFNDITEAKEAEQALRRSEERYRNLFENANDIIVLLDAAGRFTGINRAGEQATGYARGEFLQLSLEDVLWPEYWQSARDALQRALAGQTMRPFELAARRRDGTRLELEISAQALVESGSIAGVQVIARDLSERKLLQEQLLQAQKMEAVGRLAGGIAHDFNNLLTVISGYSEMLMDLCGDPHQRAAAETVFSAAGRAASLTAQLLAFSRKQVLQPRVISLNQVISGVSEMLRRLIGDGVDLITVLDSGLLHVRADPAQMEQVIINLSLNARDAMPNGGKLVMETSNAVLDEESSRRHAPVEPGHYVRLAISDTGCGMDDATRARIFEPFFTTKERGKGTGLGLATVFGIVRQSGGWIWVYSEPGRGSTFEIYLPVVPDAVSGDAAVLERELAGHETVLVVEDQAEVRALVREILERNGYRMLEADSFDAALRACEAHGQAVSLLMTDLVIGRRSGRELADQIRALHPEMRVLYMSGCTEAASGGSPTDRNANFLEKPFTAVSLTHKVRQALGLAAVAGARQ